MADLVGQMLDRYRVVGLLGAGGMGSVYRARDTELGRDVAIKVLSEDANQDAQRLERFNREIRTVARLSNPHIVEVFDFGCAVGKSYAVMELLHGHNLRDTMRGRPLPVERALSIGVAVAEGLGAAHHQGVLHRDIKPENIFVTSADEVKILDFGLAREVIPAEPHDTTVTATETVTAPDPLTSPGTILGTTGYMSPEQVRGQLLDSRSDIFSLGCVLYEMLAGRHPFRRETRVDTLSAILDHDPVPLTEIRPGLPPGLGLIVDRCLQKQPGDRFESSRDVAFALRALSGSQASYPLEVDDTVPIPRRTLRRAAAALAVAAFAAMGLIAASRLLPVDLPAEQRIAVIPFEPIPAAGDLRELAVGLSELLAADLSLIEHRGRVPFWVVPPGDARYMGAASREAMHRTFNANVVLTGTLERRGSRLSLNVMAVEAGSGRRIRSASLDHDLGNVSSFQIEPILRTAELLELEVPEEVRDWVQQEATSVAGAFQPYLRAVGILAGATEDGGTDTAIGLLEEATRHDPLFFPAREALGGALGRKYQETGEEEWLERGLGEVRLALDRRPSERGYEDLATLYTLAGDNPKAAAALEEEVRLAPDSGAAQFALGRAYERMGRFEDAETAYQRSANLRPGYWPGPNRLARLYYSLGRYDAAANEWRQVMAFAPSCTQGYNNLGAVYFQLGRLDEARAMFERSIEVEPERNYQAYSNLGTINDQEARFADAAVMYEKALAIEDGAYNVWGNFAYALTFGSDPERAREPFQRAIELAEQARRTRPDDPELLSRLAGFHVMTGDHRTGLELLEETIRLDPVAPSVIANIGETFEDLGERDRALEWIGRALEGGIQPQYFARRPMLRELIADPRYRELLVRPTAPPAGLESPS